MGLIYKKIESMLLLSKFKHIRKINHIKKLLNTPARCIIRDYVRNQSPTLFLILSRNQIARAIYHGFSPFKLPRLTYMGIFNTSTQDPHMQLEISLIQGAARWQCGERINV